MATVESGDSLSELPPATPPTAVADTPEEITLAPVEDDLPPHPMYTPQQFLGIPRNPKDASALLRSYIPQIANPITAQLSFGRMAIPNLVIDLKVGPIGKTQKALVSLTELFHSPQNVSQGIAANVVHHLIILLPSENITCRQKASEALKILSSHAIGRTSILSEKGCVIKMSKSFEDEDDLTRKNVQETLSNISGSDRGVSLLLDNRLFEKLCSILPKERLDIQALILNTCYQCIRLGDKRHMPAVAINSLSLEIFSRVASNSKVLEVQVAACECVMMLCFYHECKKIASTGQVIADMIALLGNGKSPVRAASAGALMSISINNDAKRVLVRDNALKLLSKLLDDENELVQLNSIKTITNCSEDYRGRFLLSQSLDKLKTIAKSSPNQHVAQAANTAIKIITWRP